MGRKYTNKELFTIIISIMKGQGILPDLLDYALAESHVVEIINYQWDTIGRLNFGGNEGIYLDIYAEGSVTTLDKPERIRLGTFKTLHGDREALYKMAKLEADFVWETRRFVNSRLDDFTWLGYDVTFYRNGKKTVSYTCHVEEAKERALKNHLATCDYAVVRDNMTRKESVVYPDYDGKVC